MYNIPNIRIVILWPKTQEFWDETIAALENNLTILQQYEIQWTPERVQSNYSRFFERSLTSAEIESQYGRGSFRLCVVELPNGQTFGDVTEYFQKKGFGCEGVYISLSEEKANRDITLLLGKNISDWCCEHKDAPESLICLTKDLEGAAGWENLQRLFYVMNNTMNYCVLRNTEDITTDFSPEIHGDIDIVVESAAQANFIMQAVKVHKESYRAYHKVHTMVADIPFDIRYVGDGYYSKKWEHDMIESSGIVEQDGLQFKRMSSEQEYYSLLYHVYLQKQNIAEDYPLKLASYAKRAGVDYVKDCFVCMKQLEHFMIENEYQYVLPIDIAVGKNWKNIKLLRNYWIIRLEFLLDKAVRKLKKILK